MSDVEKSTPPVSAAGRGAPRLSFVPLAFLLGLTAGCTTAVDSVSPPSVAAGGPAFKLTVLGRGFSGSSTVQWNGTSRSTTFVSATELVAQINTADIAATGNASITVTGPDSIGASSGSGTSGSGSTATSNARSISIVSPSVDAADYQIDPLHDGAMTFTSVSFPSSPVWRASLGAGTPSNVVIADGKVFLSTGSSAGSRLLALQQSNGATAWGPKTLPAAASGDVAYDNGRVFVSGGDSLYAYDAGNGSLDWTAALGATSAGPPTAADGLVYVIVSGNATLYALDETTGAITWQQSLSAASGTMAATADGLYVTATTSGCHTIDFRPATGEVIWDSAESTGYCPLAAEGTPIVANQLVYSPDSSGTSIFAAETGSSSGTLADPLPAAFTGNTSATVDTAYFPLGANLDAVNLTDGTVTWTFNGDGSELTALPVIVNDQTANVQYVITGSSDGFLYAIEGASGKQAWTQALGGQVRQLAAGDGLLLAVDETNSDGSGTLTAYTISTNP
jgi:outer membrane protein assembly factor BamB